MRGKMYEYEWACRPVHSKKGTNVGRSSKENSCLLVAAICLRYIIPDAPYTPPFLSAPCSPSVWSPGPEWGSCTCTETKCEFCLCLQSFSTPRPVNLSGGWAQVLIITSRKQHGDFCANPSQKITLSHFPNRNMEI